MGSCKLSFIHLPFLCKQKPKTLHKISLSSSSTRRGLLLFTLPISGLLLSNTSPLSCAASLPKFDPVSPSEKDASAVLSQRVSEAVELLEKGRELQAQGDFRQALDYYTQVPHFFIFSFNFLLKFS